MKKPAMKPGDKLYDVKGRIIGTQTDRPNIVLVSDNFEDDYAEDAAAELAAAKARRDFRRMLRRKRNVSWFERLLALPDNRGL